MSSKNRTEESPEVSRRSFLRKGAGAAAVIAAAGGIEALTKAGPAYPADSDRTIRLAVVGGGFGADQHWHLHPNCEVTAVTDLRPGRREKLQKTYDCDTAYDSLQEMIQEESNVDAVAIFSGAPKHADHVRMCMEKGWHVVCAVPACTSLREARMLKRTKERTGLIYMMHETSYYRQNCIFARNLYQQGGLGEVFYSELEYYHDLAASKGLIYNPDGSRSWRFGYPPMHYPTHCLGLLVGVTGERITKVSATGWGSEMPEIDVDVYPNNVYGNPFSNEMSMMQTDSGHTTRCNVCWRIVAGGERAQWFGQDASLYMPNHGLHDEALKLRGNVEQGDIYDLPEFDSDRGKLEIPQYWKDSEMLPPAMRVPSGHGGSHTFLSAEFINALLEEREPAIDLYDSLAMTVPGIVAHESALQGGTLMDVPQFDPGEV